MTDQVDNTHNPTPATEPLALRLSEGLGPLSEATRTLAVLTGKRHWYWSNEYGAHGEGVYSAGEATVYALREVRRAVAAESERCCRLIAVQMDSEEVARRTILAIRAGDDFHGVDDPVLRV
jgi:hypothetical protein